jgi:hypothetical protein
MAHRKIRLPLTDAPHPFAYIENPLALPLEMDGGDEADLVCGGCGAITHEGFKDLYHIHTDFQVVLVCPECGKKNVLPVTPAPNEDSMGLRGG